MACSRSVAPSFVMPGLVPGIHVLCCCQKSKTWMAGTSPAMTAWAALSGGIVTGSGARSSRNTFAVRLEHKVKYQLRRKRAPSPACGRGLGWGSHRESSGGESPHPGLRADFPRKRERCSESAARSINPNFIPLWSPTAARWPGASPAGLPSPGANHSRGGRTRRCACRRSRAALGSAQVLRGGCRIPHSRSRAGRCR
jgi:hypothetical protein